MEILNHQQVTRKIKRIAYQIAEVFMDHEQLVLAGIADGGYELALCLKKELSTICDFEIVMCKVMVDKKNPLQELTTSLEQDAYKNKGAVFCRFW